MSNDILNKKGGAQNVVARVTFLRRGIGFN
jgi:hypothetical protein